MTASKPLAPRRTSTRVETPLLLQFLLLSMLLHMLVILLFGTTNYGSARRGDSLFGTLDVTLRELSPERGSGFTLAPGTDSTLPGAALLRRLEGLTNAPVALPKRDVAQPGPTSPPAIAPAAPAPAEQVVPEATLSNRPPPAETLPHLDRSAPVEVDKPLVTPAPVPPREIVLPSAPPIERLAPATIEQQATPSLEFKPRETPIPTAAPLEPVAPAKIERQVTPVELPAPRKAPAETSAPPVSTAPPVRPEREATPAPPATPVPPVPSAPPAPQVVPRSEKVETTPARERAAPATTAPAAATPTTPAPAKVAPAPARSDTGTGGDLPRLRYGSPNVDEEVFGSRRDVVAPSSDAEGKPAITADSLRKRASEIAREGSASRGVLNLVPPPPPVERKDKLAEDMAKAAKPDCRTAYADMGLLAIAPLVASTVGNGGCRW